MSCSDAQWVERDAHRIEESRLPKSEGDRLALAEQIGEDGKKVLTAVFDPLAPDWLRDINSPYDPEARLGKKRSTLWTGYKVHLTSPKPVSRRSPT